MASIGGAISGAASAVSGKGADAAMRLKIGDATESMVNDKLALLGIEIPKRVLNAMFNKLNDKIAKAIPKK